MHKVVLLIDNFGLGGAQRQMGLLADGLSRRGFDVVLLFYAPDVRMLKRLDLLGLRQVSVAKGRFGRISLAWNIKLAVKREAPSSVISFLDGPNKAMGVAKLMGANQCWIAGERNLEQGRSFLKTAWRRVLYRGAAAVISNSESQSRWIKSVIPWAADRATTVWNGVELRDPAPCHDRDILNFVSLGRVGTQKDPQNLLRAVSRLSAATRGHVCFRWYGDEDVDCLGMRAALNQEATSLGLPISFHPASLEPEKILAAASCMVLPSRFEGLPNVVLEAMASGVPVVSTAVSDVPRLLESGRGITCPPEDSLRLASAIEQFIALSNEEKAQMARSAREYVVAHCSIEKMVNRYASVLTGGSDAA